MDPLEQVAHSGGPVLLGVCYDKVLLSKRLDVIKGLGIVGMPASSKKVALEVIRHTKVDILVVCPDLPEPDRTEISQEFKRIHAGPVIWAQPLEAPRPAWVDIFLEPDQPAILRSMLLDLVTKARKNPPKPEYDHRVKS